MKVPAFGRKAGQESRVRLRSVLLARSNPETTRAGQESPSWAGCAGALALTGLGGCFCGWRPFGLRGARSGACEGPASTIDFVFPLFPAVPQFGPDRWQLDQTLHVRGSALQYFGRSQARLVAQSLFDKAGDRPLRCAFAPAGPALRLSSLLRPSSARRLRTLGTLSAEEVQQFPLRISLAPGVGFRLDFSDQCRDLFRTVP